MRDWSDTMGEFEDAVSLLEGTDQQHAEGLRILRKLTEAGDCRACVRLGNMYLDGNG
jgi:TPR repeat protein